MFRTPTHRLSLLELTYLCEDFADSTQKISYTLAFILCLQLQLEVKLAKFNRVKVHP